MRYIKPQVRFNTIEEDEVLNDPKLLLTIPDPDSTDTYYSKFKFKETFDGSDRL